MGVHGLWDLLAPVGRRVSVETLAGKRLAIDASIWLVQFMKAMRDERGEMVHNAHLLGFFRRICKLLFLRTKPVFVFDGGTPALKRRTVIARRRQRENAQAKVRKTAEKLLLNHLKAMKLKELENDIQNQMLKQKADGETRKNITDRRDLSSTDLGVENVAPRSYDKKISEEESQANIAAREDSIFTEIASMCANTVHFDGNNRERKGNDMEEIEKDAENQKLLHLSDAKGKGILLDDNDKGGHNSRSDYVSRNSNQEMIDELLAASIAAEDVGSLVNDEATSFGGVTSDQDDDNDEEMLLPAMHGEVDPAVLASLPPSMQLDLLVQMRERLIAENRQKYQKVKKDPTKFSELQIQAYLKTVAFRREIDEVQKSASGSGVGGIQTSRIASEANREYVFSSSFMGDKQELMSTRAGRNEDTHPEVPRKHPSHVSTNNIAQSNESSTASAFPLDNAGGVSDDSIHTYLDERGYFRVSRLRAMGMRMTRDIERNLDIMKELEQERANVGNAVFKANEENMLRSSNSDFVDSSNEGNVDLVALQEESNPPLLKEGTSIEVSFEDDSENRCIDGDDHLFAALVSGTPTIFFEDNNSLRKKSYDSDSEVEWEEGNLDGKLNISNDANEKIKHSFVENAIVDESELEWEERDCNGAKSIADSGNTLSKGYLEEQAKLQEAIRRSLEDVGNVKSPFLSYKDDASNTSGLQSKCVSPQDESVEGIGLKVYSDGVRQMDGEHNIGVSMMKEDGDKQNVSHCKLIDRVGNLNHVGRSNDSKSIEYPEKLPKSSVTCNSDKKLSLEMKPCEKCPDFQSKKTSHKADRMMMNDVQKLPSQPLDTSNGAHAISSNYNKSLEANSYTFSVIQADRKYYDDNAEPSSHHHPTPPAVGLPMKEQVENIIEQELEAEFNNKAMDNNSGKDSMSGHEDVLVEANNMSLEEEMMILNQERIDLGNEQRKLERKAESVRSEMFTECQELLQMFGLPYIIAPMEAEAQCAYMELAKLVDGVVTDDSDVFLFGAHNVYKNIFDDRKYVETYFMEDIEKELGLTREKLIHMALLLGSDYTEGVSGIGIVNAIEVVNAFPEEGGLLKFREWVESPDPTILGKIDAKTVTRKRVSKVDEDASNCNLQEVSLNKDISRNDEQAQAPSYIQEVKQKFLDKHRNVSKNWHIPSSFPSEAVISAYSCPQVDKSTEPFTWGKPDHLVLRKLCWEKFGWASQKADDLLLPVLKEYNKHETQLRLEAFYTFNERFAKIRSNRIKKAVKGITGKQIMKSIDDSNPGVSKSRKKETSPTEPGDAILETSNNEGESLADLKKKLKSKHSSKRKNSRSSSETMPSKKISEDPTPCEVENLEQSKEGQKFKNEGFIGNIRGRERGRGGLRGRGRGKRNTRFEICASTSSDSDDADGAQGIGEGLKGSEGVRRSTRARKPVNYHARGMETDVEDDCRDAASDFSLEKERDAGNTTLMEDLCSGHCEAGGGFCTNKDAVGQPGVNQIYEPPFSTESCKEYLKMGGGFCTEENVEESAAFSSLPGFVAETDGDNHGDELCCSPENAVNELQKRARDPDLDSEAPVGALSAMPCLRRKKRRR